MNIRINKKGSLHNLLRLTDYPAGETGILIEKYSIYDYLEIHACIYNERDFLVFIGLLNDKELMMVVKDIYINYLGFQRQDKEKYVELDGVNYKEVVLSKVTFDAILSPEYTARIHVLDPHSTEIDIHLYAKYKYNKELYVIKPVLLYNELDYDAVVFPDMGAYERYGDRKEFDMKDMIVFNKVRDDHGDVSLVPNEDIGNNINIYDRNYNFLVFDDICDGGATFIAIAEYFEKINVQGRLFLQVTHGLFTKGKGRLFNHYNQIRSINEMPRKEDEFTA